MGLFLLFPSVILSPPPSSSWVPSDMQARRGMDQVGAFTEKRARDSEIVRQKSIDQDFFFARAILTQTENILLIRNIF